MRMGSVPDVEEWRGGVLGAREPSASVSCEESGGGVPGPAPCSGST